MPARLSALLVLDGATAPVVCGRDDRKTCDAVPIEHLAGLVASYDLTEVSGIAVTVGPGSFTGLRATLALAHGIAQARGIALVPVTIAEAYRAQWTGPTPLWVALDNRRGRVFLDTGSGFATADAADLPRPAGFVAVAGDASAMVTAALPGTVAHGRPRPSVTDIAAAARQRIACHLPPLAARPLYIDPPEAKRPAGGLRPFPR